MFLYLYHKIQVIFTAFMGWIHRKSLRVTKVSTACKVSILEEKTNSKSCDATQTT